MSITEINKEMGILTTHDAVKFVINVKKELPKVPILDIIKLSYQYRFQSNALGELKNYLEKKQEIQDYIENLNSAEIKEGVEYGLALYDFDIYMTEYVGTKEKELDISNEYWEKFKKENHVKSHYPGIYDYLYQLPGREVWQDKISRTYKTHIEELKRLKQILDEFKKSSVSNGQYQGFKGGSIKKKRRSSKRKSLKRKSLKRKSLKKKKSTKRKKRKRKTKRMR